MDYSVDIAMRLLIINCVGESVVSVALCYVRELLLLLIKWVVTLAQCGFAVYCPRRQLYRDVGSFMGWPLISRFIGCVWGACVGCHVILSSIVLSARVMQCTSTVSVQGSGVCLL